MPSTSVGRPGVRVVLALVALLPVVATGWLAASRLSASATYRRQAAMVADAAAQLEEVTHLRVQLNAIAVPLETVAFANDIGLTSTDIDAVLQPEVPFADQLDDAIAQIDRLPALSST